MAKHETSMLGELREPYQREVHALIGEFLHFSCCEYAPHIIYDIIEFALTSYTKASNCIVDITPQCMMSYPKSCNVMCDIIHITYDVKNYIINNI